MTPERHEGIHGYRYADDSYSGSEPSGVPCPECGRDLVTEYECRHRRPPSLMWAACRGCGAWYDLGKSPLTGADDVSQEAGRRAREAFARGPRQTTLEAWA